MLFNSVDACNIKCFSVHGIVFFATSLSWNLRRELDWFGGTAVGVLVECDLDRRPPWHEQAVRMT